MAIDKTVTEESGAGSTLVRSLEETASVAACLLPMIREAGCASLEGPLGAGKTHFVKAVASLLGVSEPVSSPTFTILHSYQGVDCHLHHSDWYRLESEGEVLGLSLEEYLGDGVILIEWGDKFPSLLPPGSLRISITPMDDSTRLIRWS